MSSKKAKPLSNAEKKKLAEQIEKAKQQRRRFVKQATINKSMVMRSLSNSQIHQSGEFVSMVCKDKPHDTIDESQPHIHNPLRSGASSIVDSKQSGTKAERRTKTLVIMSQLDLKDHRHIQPKNANVQRNSCFDFKKDQ